MPGKVVLSRYYRTPTGGRVSIYSSHVPPGSELVIDGFTIEHPDGTVGLGRGAFTTKAEAQAWVDANPRFPGMNQG